MENSSHHGAGKSTKMKGLSNREATETIIKGLKGLLKEREENFRDHLEKRKKKAQVALKRIFHPFTLLALAYTGFLIYNTHELYQNGEYQSKHLQTINHDSLITQHIITICVVLLLVIIDVYLKIQRLNFRVFNIDSKIQQVIEKFDPENATNNDIEDERKSSAPGLFNLNKEVEFSYYQNCFSWTLRNGQWKKIPNNTLAEGDTIKLLPDDKAPALVVAVRDDDSPQDANVQSSFNNLGASQTQTIINSMKMPSPQLYHNPQSMNQKDSQRLYFNKGSKIDMKTGGYQKRFNVNDASEASEAFEKSMKEYIVFKVLKTPCVQDLTEYISNMETRKEFSKNLLYFSNLQKTENIVTIFLAVSWSICVTINIVFIYTDNIIDYFDHHTYLPLIGFTFVGTQIFAVCEAWANALMITLFSSLQFDDYNKRFSGRNYYKQLKKQAKGGAGKTGLGGGQMSAESAELQANMSVSVKRPLLRSERKRRNSFQEQVPFITRLMAWFLCRRITTPNENSNHKRRRGKGKKSQSRRNKEIIGFVKTDDFYEIYDFQNRGFRKNWSKFWEFYRSGCTHINNIFASLSCVSVFAFVDKEGIISEMAKYVDEIAVIDKHEQKVVLDLVHDTHVAHEEDIYAFENDKLYKDNLPLLRALGLAFMCARNPRENDTEKQMQEIFTKLPTTPAQVNLLDNGSIDEFLGTTSTIKHEIGFHFHNALKQETETHQDCVCALAKLIGHTDSSFLNYEPLTSVWNIQHNPQMSEANGSDKDRERKINKEFNLKEKEDKKHRSFDDQLKSNEQDSLFKYDEGENSMDDKDPSIKSDETIKGKDIFAEHKQRKKMLLERIFKFGHTVQTIALDKSSNKYQSFSRGEASIIRSMCSDYWDGEKVMPIKKEVANHIKDILFQWQASDFVAIGFSYKPVTPDLQKLINDNKLKESELSSKYSKEIRETLETFNKNQIFLGIIGVKHHKKQEANKMFRSLEDAGIRGVLFSKEGVLETKSLAKELGIDSDWNAWISLSESPSDFTKLYNEDGHLILPYGIQGIRKHIEEVDKIPLQVPMFCDSTAETTRQMFQIYQENGDVVAAIGNIMNSENMHIFQQANVAVGMMIEPSYRCYRCNGRISKIQQPPQGSFKRSEASYQAYKPSKLERLSAAINSLACTFVFDANTNIYCFFSVFREARRLRESVEQAMLLALFSYLTIFLILFIDLTLGVYHYCEQLEVLAILCISVPLFSVSCLSRPTKNSVMKRHVLSPKYLQYLDFAVFMLKANIVKVMMVCILIYMVRILYFREAIDRFKEIYPIDYKLAFEDPLMEANFSQQVSHLLYGNWYTLKAKYAYWNESIAFEHKFNFCFLLVIMSYMCIGLESPKSTLFYKFTSNYIFKLVLILQILFIIAYYAISTTVFQDQQSQLYYPTYRVYLAAIAALSILAIFEETTKKHIRKLYERDHNRLSIFFSTKLGMWSPR